MSGQLSYPLSPIAYLEGQRATGGNYGANSFLNPLLAQVGTLTAGGTVTSGVYSVTFRQTNDPSFAPVTISHTRVGESSAGVAIALNAAINASAAMQGIASSVDGGGGVLTLTFKNTGVSWTVTTTAPAPGTLVWAQTVAAGGFNVRVAGWCRHTAAASGADILVPITTSMTIAEAMGIAERTYLLVNDIISAFDYYPPGTRVSAGRSGIWAVPVWEAVTEFSAPAIWIDPADATAFAGQMGTTVTGGKSIDASTKCRYLSRAAAGGIVLVEVFFGA